MKWTINEASKNTHEGPYDSKEVKPVNPKGNQPWIFIGRTGAKAEAPKFWPLNVKSWLIGKDPDAGKDWEQEEKRYDRGWANWMASLIPWTWVWANIGRLWNREARSAAVHGVTKSWIWLSDWTTTEYYGRKIKSYPSDWIYVIIVKVIDYPWVWAQQMLKLLGGRQLGEIVFWERTNMLI